MFISGRVVSLAVAPLFTATLLCAACGGSSSAQPSPTVGGTEPSNTATLAAATNGIYVVDVASLAVRQLPLPDGKYFGPAWSHDGSRIAFTSFADIYISDPEGADVKQLTSNGRSNYLPAWSPDDSKLVFISGGAAGTEELYVIGSNGQDERRVTDDTFWDYRADWSSDGSVIVGGSERPEGWRVFTVRADGGGLALLPTPAHGNAISWSPGGTIAFTSNRDGDDDIYVMNRDGSAQQNLSMNGDHDDNAAWSPDGKQLAFSSDRSGKNEIYIMNADGSNVRQITSDPRIIPNIPTWSPDGGKIAFSADAAEGSSP